MKSKSGRVAFTALLAALALALSFLEGLLPPPRQEIRSSSSVMAVLAAWAAPSSSPPYTVCWT